MSSLPRLRHQSRYLALQALYQWEITHDPIPEIERQFLLNNAVESFEPAYFQELLQAIPAEHTELDKLFFPYLDRAVETLDVIERILLRMGTYELKSRLDIPYRVVLNEAIELAKMFAGVDGHRYVNGVLHQVAQQLRSQEIT